MVDVSITNIHPHSKLGVLQVVH